MIKECPIKFDYLSWEGGHFFSFQCQKQFIPNPPSYAPWLQVRAHSRIPLMWPLVIYHKVGELSPLYTLDPEHLDKERFEIIVKVSGVRSESGGTIFSTTSYTNTELSWGQVII